MSLEIFVNEVLNKQENREWLLSDPATLEEGKRIAQKVKTGELVITDMEPGLLPLAIIAHLTEHALEVNGARGIPREQTIETLRDVNVWLDGYYEQEGVRAFGEYCWLRRHYTGTLFAIGRLQFCLEENAGLAPEGEMIIDTHIPRGGKLTEEECLRSFAMAEEFFDKYFPGHGAKYFYCHSWLLSKDQEAVCGENSNILKFSRLWNYVPCEPDQSAQAIRHVFGINYVRDDIEQFPVKTSLQRKVKAYLQDGNDINIGSGYRPTSKVK
jgi:hypothetical protein